MPLLHALSQLAILGATSIVLRNGHICDLGDADALLLQSDDGDRFELRIRESWTDLVDAVTGRCFGRAKTLWQPHPRVGNRHPLPAAAANSGR